MCGNLSLLFSWDAFLPLYLQAISSVYVYLYMLYMYICVHQFCCRCAVVKHGRLQVSIPSRLPVHIDAPIAPTCTCACKCCFHSSTKFRFVHGILQQLDYTSTSWAALTGFVVICTNTCPCTRVSIHTSPLLPSLRTAWSNWMGWKMCRAHPADPHCSQSQSQSSNSTSGQNCYCC